MRFRFLSAAGAASLLASAASPALAHAASGSLPHWHASDFAGIGAVLAITLAAAWADRRLARRTRP